MQHIIHENNFTQAQEVIAIEYTETQKKIYPFYGLAQ